MFNNGFSKITTGTDVACLTSATQVVESVWNEKGPEMFCSSLYEDCLNSHIFVFLLQPNARNKSPASTKIIEKVSARASFIPVCPVSLLLKSRGFAAIGQLFNDPKNAVCRISGLISEAQRVRLL
ncbi:hypothetical protein V8G54_017759 [Vigna mungo]|uniref:Uncharacterized protein n=1 Tax=Vigna mungo TaxID=3915 RepID=A0AAQ3NMS5_VIGMU